VIALADNIDAKAIVAETRSGATALQIASQRPMIPLIAVTNDLRTAQQLTIVYGIKSYVRPVDPDAAQKLSDWLLSIDVFKKDQLVIMVSGRHPGVPGGTDTIRVRALGVQ